MSKKISYHKNCRQHEQVSKAKRMLNKIAKKYPWGSHPEFYCDMNFTGINELDRGNVKRYIESHLKDLKLSIEKQLNNNELYLNGELNEKYEEGFWIPTFKSKLQLIEELNEVYNFIWNNYPVIPFQKSEVYIFKGDSPEAKYNEAKRKFENHPVLGYNHEYYAELENGKHKRLYSLTFSSFDLKDATGIYYQFQ
jgi:hypothetical protein